MELYVRKPGAGRQKIGRVNVVAEIKEAQNLGILWRANRLYLKRCKAALAAMYLRRDRVVGRDRPRRLRMRLKNF
jgi:hypothetical protein